MEYVKSVTHSNLAVVKNKCPRHEWVQVPSQGTVGVGAWCMADSIRAIDHGTGTNTKDPLTGRTLFQRPTVSG